MSDVASAEPLALTDEDILQRFQRTKNQPTAHPGVKRNGASPNARTHREARWSQTRNATAEAGKTTHHAMT